jgi:hypothetical protein
METHHLQYFDPLVGEKYLLHEFGNRDYGNLTKREKDVIKTVNILSEFHKTGSIQPVKEQPVLKGKLDR